MGIHAGSLSKISIGTTAAHSNQTEYEADTYALIESTESIGEFGDTQEEVTFVGLSDGRTQRKKGTSDAGTIDIVFAFDEAAISSGGQADLLAASADTSSDDYNFKVEYNDGSTTNSIRYFSGQVGSFKEGVPGANNILMVTSNVRINTPILRVAAT